MHVPRSNRSWRLSKLAPLFVAASLLGGCFNDDDAQRPYSRQVVFGDSLSDVGTYAVGAVASLGGGKFTVNSIPAGRQIWNEHVAAQLGLAAPCAAQTGLEGDPAQGLSAPIAEHVECTNYAQGGARVTDPVGPHNKAVEPALGHLTVPVAAQISNHLSRNGGSFSSSELVFVFAGGNDFLWQSDVLTAAVVASLSQQIAADIFSGACEPVDANGSNCIGGAIGRAVAAQAPIVVAAMEQAGSELAALVNNEIVGRGARRVVVLTLPDASLSPSAQGQSAEVLTVVNAMVRAFNDKLAAGLAAGDANSILTVDVHERFKTWAANPSAYGFNNFTDPACELAKPTPNLLGSSLTCTVRITVPGDTSRHAFADKVHPAPYMHEKLAEFVLDALSRRGWR